MTPGKMTQTRPQPRRISTFLVHASVGDDGQFVARITVITDLATGSTVQRVVATPDDVVRAIQMWLRDLGYPTEGFE